MKCKKCKTVVELRADVASFKYEPFNKLLDLSVYKVPFYCDVCGSIVFKLKALHDFVFIWPIPLGEKFVDGGLIGRPENMNKPEDELYGRSPYGVVLSSGPGYYDKKRFNPTPGLLTGMKVAYDTTVPWSMDFLSTDKKQTTVVYCTFGDVKGVVS